MVVSLERRERELAQTELDLGVVHEASAVELCEGVASGNSYCLSGRVKSALPFTDEFLF